ncbi:hypothetical protein ASG84_10485 [Rhodococcus sp. Leaf278]|uniref:hypothetical protein n=1 Tax=Rhodococcus sp. Leaf278 TaxID=1736319 RepID=UPI00070B23E8|nr:hypothetical protein [Rhodococcus sp. Leaf278]KQU45745.1 hypothetical protein ASG84_10485 [Rhodococcus sp. Leaf278]
MDTAQTVIVFYIAIWVGVSAVAAMVGKRRALSWVSAVAWTLPAAWLTLIGAWILPDRSVFEPAASMAPSELWPVDLALAVWATPFAVVAAWLRSGRAIRNACTVCGIAAAAGVAVTLFQMENPDELIFLTTRSDRPQVYVVVGFALTVTALVLAASVVRQPEARHVARLVAGAVVFGGAGVTLSMGGLAWLSWLCVAAAAVALIIAAINADRLRNNDLSRERCERPIAIADQ